MTARSVSNWGILAMAAGLSAFVTAFNWWSGQTEDLALRALYLAALVCLGADTRLTSEIGVGPPRWSNPERWVMAGYHGWLFTASMVLFMWDGAESFATDLFGALFGGAIYGVLSVFFTMPETERHTVDATIWAGPRYDLSAPITDRPFAGWMYRLWPLVLLRLFAGFALFPPRDGWHAHFLLFQLVLFTTLLQRYPPRRGGGAIVSRAVGATLLGGGLFWSYAKTL
jgi:hypothetical protein